MKSRVRRTLPPGLLWHLAYSYVGAAWAAPAVAGFVAGVLDPVLPGGRGWIWSVTYLVLIVAAGIAADDAVPYLRRQTTSVITELRADAEARR